VPIDTPTAQTKSHPHHRQNPPVQEEEEGGATFRTGDYYYYCYYYDNYYYYYRKRWPYGGTSEYVSLPAAEAILVTVLVVIMLV